MIWFFVIQGVLCEVATFSNCQIDVRSPANNQQILTQSCLESFPNEAPLDPCHLTQYIDSPYQYTCWTPPTTQRYTVRVPYTVPTGRCRQCKECGLSGAAYRNHMNPNNCGHGCRYYHSITKYRNEYRTKTIPGKNSTCSVQYDQIRKCHNCLSCEIKPSLSVPNETTYVEYITSGRQEKQETSSQNMKMLVSMESNDIARLQHAIQKIINEIDNVIMSQFTSVEIIANDTETMRRRRDTQEAKLVKVALVIFVKLKGVKNEAIATPEFEAEILAVGFIKSLKIIPLTEESKLYFVTQQIILIVTLLACTIGAVKRYKNIKRKVPSEEAEEESETFNDQQHEEDSNNESLLQFGLIVFINFFLPILDMVPSVYVWYDYNTSKELAYDRSTFVATLLFGFTFLKVVFFVLRIIMINAGNTVWFGSPWRHQLAKQLLFGGVSGGILQFCCVDFVKPLVIYFYFNRYLNPGEYVSTAAFGCFILILIKHIHSLIYYVVKLVTKVCCSNCSVFLTDYEKAQRVNSIAMTDNDAQGIIVYFETVAHVLRYVIKFMTITTIILLTISSSVINSCLGLFYIQDELSEEFYISSTLCEIAGDDPDVRYWYRDRVVTDQCKTMEIVYDTVDEGGKKLRRASDFWLHPSPMNAGCNTTAEVVAASFTILTGVFGLFILIMFTLGHNQRNHIKIKKCWTKTDDESVTGETTNELELVTEDNQLLAEFVEPCEENKDENSVVNRIKNAVVDGMNRIKRNRTPPNPTKELPTEGSTNELTSPKNDESENSDNDNVLTKVKQSITNGIAKIRSKKEDKSILESSDNDNISPDVSKFD